MLSKEILKFIKETLNVVSDDGISGLTALTDGKSGAEVYRIKVDSRRLRDSGVYILKLIDIKSPWYNSRDNEVVKAELFHASASDFISHLVKLKSEQIVGDKHVIIYRQANNSVINTVSLNRLDSKLQAIYLSKISLDLLQTMNTSTEKVQGYAGFFDNLLSYRLVSKGSFENAINRIVDNPNATAIIISGNIYPNPLYYLRHQNDWLANVSNFSVFKGNVHGDLHRRNILCNKEFLTPSEPSYSIIDYDTFSNNSYLLFDHAYLELSTFIDASDNNDLRAWEKMISTLISASPFSELEIEENLLEFRCRNAICYGIKQWVNSQGSGLLDDIEIQLLIARVAAGINYYSKRAFENDDQMLIKLLLFIGICLKTLFYKINFEYNDNDASRLVYRLSENENVDMLWENCVKYSRSYVPILITDDHYQISDYKKFDGLSAMNWFMILDIGSNTSPSDVSSYILQEMVGKPSMIHNLSTNNRVDYTPNSCAILTSKKTAEIGTYGMLWLSYQNVIKSILKQIMTFNPARPLLLVFDCKNGKSYAKKFLQHIFDLIPQLQGTRFVSLSSDLLYDDQDSKETIRSFKCHYYSLTSASLVDLSSSAKSYLFPQGNNSSLQLASFPSLDGIEFLTDKEKLFYESSLELVYAGIESQTQGLSFGEDFYRGDEITWADLANGCDIPLLTNYQRKRDELLRIIEEDSPRVKALRLIHGAGTGGTTLAKRFLWDLKERVPCVKLKRYTGDTSDIILSIYRKSGMRVFLTVEVGSTIISESEIRELMSRVNEANGRLLILQITRSQNSTDIKENDDTAEIGSKFISLPDTMKRSIAENFNVKFQAMTSDSERKSFLSKITADPSQEYIMQRAPFFYGFYTFQEDYRLDNIIRTVLECNTEIKELLSDLSLITVFTQNICVNYSELPLRMNIDIDAFNIYLFFESIPTSVSKLIVFRDNGWRICHPLIAKKVLEVIYGVSSFVDCIYDAAVNYIDRISITYGSDTGGADALLKELFIDRSYIDSDRTRFSKLIEAIPESTKQELMFRHLIQKFDDNPHYYNHLARLLSSGRNKDYDESIRLLKKAISVAESVNMPLSIHYTTLGCIYSKKLLSYLANIRSTMLSGRYAADYSTIISEMNLDYSLADDSFVTARENENKRDSYQYFPHINMEYRLIEALIGCDKHKRTISVLINEDDDFRRWYYEHFSKAVSLLSEMEDHSDDYEDFLKLARSQVSSISINARINQGLTTSARATDSISQHCRRAYVSAAYVMNGYSWNDLEPSTASLIEDCMRSNILHGSNGRQLQTDIHYWFEAFRRIKTFDASEAIRFIEDYKNDGYEKEYWLSWLYFLKLERQMASNSDVIKHIISCKAMLPAGANDITFRDAYATSARGCSIISANSVKRGENRAMIGLREFEGIITSVHGSTSGIILLDKLNLDVVFVPTIIDEEFKKREYTPEHVGHRVKFNLMFAYSGLRAWNVRE